MGSSLLRESKTAIYDEGSVVFCKACGLIWFGMSKVNWFYRDITGVKQVGGGGVKDEAMGEEEEEVESGR